MELCAALGTFLRDAWRALEQDHVLPRPRYQPHVRVGRDYFGDTIRSIGSYERLEAAIEATDARFTEAVPLGERDFASNYIYDALELFIANVTRSGNWTDDVIDATCAAVKDGLALPRPCATARVVTDISTRTPEPTLVGDLAVVPLPEPGAGSSGELLGHLRDVFGSRVGDLADELPMTPFDTSSLLVARYETANRWGAEPERDPGSTAIDDFILAVRLLHAATAHSSFEVRGSTRDIGPGKPHVGRFISSGWSEMGGAFAVRRAALISPKDGPGIAAFISMLHSELGDVSREPTCLPTAIRRFQASFHKHLWSDKLIDLTIALEAALSGSARTDILLRLQSRAAGLLATPVDTESRLFNDIKLFYKLRSAFVHGAVIRTKEITKTVDSISRVPRMRGYESLRSDAVIDRLRDIVRRAILARLCVAASDPDLWPLDSDAGVDEKIASHESREALRAAWQDKLMSFDHPRAADPASVPRPPGTGAVVVGP